jgi:drug/metabolite transporter (DMT)-like permease
MQRNWISVVWVLVTLFAAIFQTSRTALQHRLRSLLSVSGAGFVRYVYGAPIALGAVAIAKVIGADLPSISAGFWWKIAVGGLAQILATILLIRAFDARNFAIGTVFSKTEVIQVALFSFVFLGEGLRVGGYLAVAVSLLGVALLITKGASFDRSMLKDRAALYGSLAGGLFGLAAVSIRGATKNLSGAPAPVKALVALAVMNTFQTVVHGSYLGWREPGQAKLAIVHWRSSAVVGVLSVCGSACWALAFVLQNAARVRTLGQVELLFTFAISHFWLKDKHVGAEYVASGLVLAGVAGVIAFG